MELDFLSGMVNIGIMAGLVGIVEGVKSADKNSDTRSVLYVIIFFAVCLIGSIAMAMKNGMFLDHWTIGAGDAVEKFIIYFGLGTVFYKVIVKWITAKVADIEGKINDRKNKADSSIPS